MLTMNGTTQLEFEVETDDHVTKVVLIGHTVWTSNGDTKSYDSPAHAEQAFFKEHQIANSAACAKERREFESWTEDERMSRWTTGRDYRISFDRSNGWTFHPKGVPMYEVTKRMVLPYSKKLESGLNELIVPRSSYPEVS